MGSPSDMTYDCSSGMSGLWAGRIVKISNKGNLNGCWLAAYPVFQLVDWIRSRLIGRFVAYY